ncbi:BON domain-containing protein [Snodgrassella sp. CFCC 13594]|uniref:BON domain-containing protein n=1 Tax=Snodgrassella sp. CFCC 13594 TaxID=1775559 RepID=UPI000833E4E7|nr:BON domain-containing protein [Snodgrassella sp. CFCC 13594]
MKKPLSMLILATVLTCGLGGCAAAVVGGAGAAALSATDRRTTGAQADDQVMEVRIRENALSYLNTQTQPENFSPKLSVVSYNRQILLLGLVANANDKATVERIARAQSAAQKVYNYIDVATQARGLGNVTDDTWVTSKVRTTLLNAPGLSPNHLKVVTYNGVTYVMGVLTPAEQQVATQTVSTTSGVKKVVTLYQSFEPATSGTAEATP